MADPDWLTQATAGANQAPPLPTTGATPAGAPGGSPYFPTTTPQQEHQVIGDVKKAYQEKMGADSALQNQSNRAEQRYHERVADMEARQGHEIGELQKWDAQGELQKRDVSLWEQFGQPAFVLSMLASAFSAKPMNAALEAGGMAMQSLKQNRMDDYQRAFDAWKQNTDLAVKRFNMEHTLHSEYAEDWSKDIESARLKAQQAAARFGDKKMMAFLNADMYGEMLDYKDKEARTMKDMAAAQEQIYSANLKMRFVQGKLEESGIDLQHMKPEDLKKAAQIQMLAQNMYDHMGDAKQRALAEADIQSLNDNNRTMNGKELLDFQAKEASATSKAANMDHLVAMKNQELLAAGKPNMTADEEKQFRLEKPNASRSAIVRVMEETKANGGDLQAQMKAGEQMQYYMRRASQLGLRSGQVDAAVNDMEGLKPALLAASAKVPRGNWTKWNAIQQNIKMGTSSPEMRDLVDLVQGFKNAAVQAMLRGGATSVFAQQKADQMISTIEGPKSLEHAINTLILEGHIAQAAVEEAVGLRDKEKEKPLSERSTESLQQEYRKKKGTASQ